MTAPSDWEALGLVVLAGLLGAAIGFEREMAEKPAGLRTHMLVASAAGLIVVLGRIALAEAEGTGISGDPARGLHAVITGIGFLGDGAIISDRSEHRVRGLTTETSIFFAAAVGGVVAFGEIILAVGATVLAIATLSLLHWLETRVRERVGDGGPDRSDD